MGKFLVAGAGLFGLTMARLIVEKSSKAEVVVVDKRNHIGGNAYSYLDKESGVEVHKYGSHIFHTNNERVWNFINRFTDFHSYEHRVFTRHKNEIYSLPLNLHTLSQFFGLPLSPLQAKMLIKEKSSKFPTEPSSFEDAAIQTVGRELYEAFFRGYTVKQWQTDPKDLPAEVFTRLPVRFDFDSRYFSDRYQGIPYNGYGEMFRALVDHPRIAINLETDFFDMSKSGFDRTIYTGPVDRYFDFSAGELGWRTLDFDLQTIEEEDFQGVAQLNYPDQDFSFTRIHEYKHYMPEERRPKSSTVIAKEYSRKSGPEDEPYYPIRSKADMEMLKNYRRFISREKKVIFGGRLGSYQYLDMHMAIASAFVSFEKNIENSLQAD
jgi:UDP-galactopyranose mutase